MAAATDNRNWQGDGANLTRDQVANSLNGPIASGQTLKSGCLVGQLYSDTATHPALYDFVGDGTMRAVGICVMNADANTPASSPANSRPTRVIAGVGKFVDKNAGGANALGVANLFGPVYGVDNQTISALPSDGPLVGQMVAVDFQSGQPMALIDPVTVAAFQATLGPGVPSGRRARIVATSNLNLATTGLTAIDGVTPAAFDVVLCVGQSTASQNGLYYASAGAWQRVPGVPIFADMTVEISEGTVWAHSTWKCMTQGAIAVGTTSIAFYPKFHRFTSAAMVAGTLALTSLWLFSATGQIMATVNTVGGTVGPPHVNSRVAGAGSGTATLNSTGADTSTVDILIVNW